MNPNDPEPSSRGVYDVEAEGGPGFRPVEPLEPTAAEPGWDDDGLDGHDDGYGRFGRDDEYVAMRPPTRGGPRLMVVFGLVMAVILLVVAGFGVWASRQIDPSGEPGPSVGDVEVPTGSSTDAIADLLAENEVVTSAMLFRYYAGWKNVGPWKAGVYTDFQQDMSFDEAISVLDDGPIPPQTKVVRVVEGRRLVDALESIHEQMPNISVEQLNAALASGEVTSKYKTAANVENWEGFLFPDSYQFAEDATATTVLQTMATKMDEVLDELRYDKAETLQGRSAYDLMKTASLVEKEAGQPEDERGKVARVIYNRLDVDEPLGIDAALLYGLGRSAGELTQTDLETDTPYSNRTKPGLPPTPIALPGRASLQAAIEPPAGDWKYYVLVSKDPSSHLFTASYKEFQTAKADAQARGVF